MLNNTPMIHLLLQHGAEESNKSISFLEIFRVLFL